MQGGPTTEPAVIKLLKSQTLQVLWYNASLLTKPITYPTKIVQHSVHHLHLPGKVKHKRYQSALSSTVPTCLYSIIMKTMITITSYIVL